MITIKKRSVLLKNLAGKAFTLFNRLENNNNADFNTNGERHFAVGLLAAIEGPITIIDAGANTGGYTAFIIEEAEKLGKACSVHVFEPGKKAFAALEQRFGSMPHVELVNAGISSKGGEAEIFFDTEGSTLASLYHRSHGGMQAEASQKEVIHLMRLEEYISSRGIESIDLLKLDVEGHELEGLKGAGEVLSNGAIRAIQFEYGGTNLDSRTTLKDFYDLLTPAGYTMHKIMPGYLEPRAYSPALDHFQYANYAALHKDLLEAVTAG